MDKLTWTILLIEDDEDDYILTRSYLLETQKENASVVWVTSVEEALEQMDGKDAILVDYDLGTSSGLDFIRAAAAHGCKSPIILLTGQGNYDLDLNAMQLGAMDYLLKSEINASLLERSIRYAIERKRIEDALIRTQDELEMRVTERTKELQELNQQLEEINQELRAEVAERKRVEQQLVYQAYLLENVSDAIIATDQNLILTAWNRAAEDIYGWKAEEVLGRPAEDFLNTNLESRRLAHILSNLEDTGLLEGEIGHLRADGTPVFLEYRIVALTDKDGKTRGYVSVNRDATRRRQMEAELNEVHRRLMDGREAERLHLSQELHDGPIQSLYGITYQVAHMKNSSLVQPQQFEEVQETTQQVIEVLRAICGDLRPPTLTPFGLEQTIRSHADRFCHTHPDISMELNLYPDKQILPDRVRLALYRIYQQTMANIIRHAEATSVEVLFEIDAEQALLEVQDNGKGFVVPERWIDFVRDGHLGLAGSAERAEAIGGSFEVISAPSKGTRVVVAIPLET
jgi:PAS domain S-box-containing protein